MRIVSGRLKSIRISAPKNLPVRPTTDISKEALFNILNNLYEFDEISILDLFSGTGNISYEFGSRGTAQITAVDGETKCTRFIEQTSHSLEIPMHVIKSDVFKFLEKCTSTFDVIFADPPYDMSQQLFDKIVSLVFEKQLLSENGVLVIEHAKQTTKFQGNSYLSYEKNYGGSVFSFFNSEKQSEE